MEIGRERQRRRALYLNVPIILLSRFQPRSFTCHVTCMPHTWLDPPPPRARVFGWNTGGEVLTSRSADEEHADCRQTAPLVGWQINIRFVIAFITLVYSLHQRRRHNWQKIETKGETT